MIRPFILLTFFLHLNTIQAQDQIQLVDFSPSTCDDKEDPLRIKTRIVDQWYKGDTLMIEVGTVALCCVDFEPHISFNNKVLDLQFKETGIPCECDCCYQFIYKIMGLKDQKFTTTLNGKSIQYSEEKYRTKPERFEIYNGDTINRFDKYGFKQGLFILGRDMEKPSVKIVYKDDKKFQGITWIKYDKEGRIKYATEVNKGVEYRVKYHSNGQVIERCLYSDIEVDVFNFKSLVNGTEYNSLGLALSDIEVDEINFKSLVYCTEYDSLGHAISDEDCIPLEDTSHNYSSVFMVFPGEEQRIYLKDDILSLKELSSLEDIQVVENTEVLLCIQYGANQEWVNQIIEYLKRKGVNWIEINTFKAYRDYYDR